MRVAPAGVAAGASTAAAREVFAAVVKKSTFSAGEKVGNMVTRKVVQGHISSNGDANFYDR